MSLQEQPWIQATKKRWQELNAEFFLTSIGADFNSNFIEPISNSNLTADPYSNAIWQIVPHSLILQGVLHCYPKEVASEKVIWEEWFLMDNEIHHHNSFKPTICFSTRNLDPRTKRHRSPY